MKICIVTQKTGKNYGGILQAYALQHFLKQEGHIVETVQHCGSERVSFRILLSIIKQIIKKYILRKKVKNILPDWMNKQQQQNIQKNLHLFVAQHIVQTPYIHNFKKLNKYYYDAYIVGSDQVWRPKYNRYQLYEMFLSFVKGNLAKRIAYAASFGVSEIEFSEPQIKRISTLLQKFDLISVREDTAVELCNNYFQVVAHHVLDPTLLLRKTDYHSLILKEESENLLTTQELQNKDELFVYVLDQSPAVSRIIQQIANDFQYKPYNFLQLLNDETMPSVVSWLKGIMNARFVITDSFHGTVFSILFNKPFLTYANQNRGATRFLSLLKMFHLEERLVLNPESFNNNYKNPIDWQTINQIIEKERGNSINFLKNALIKF